MWSKLALLFGGSLPVLSTAQSIPINLQPGVAVEGDYSGIWRPQIHFSPPRGFMNDPNGMFLDASGTYHLYYQYNPTQTIAGNQHWGHATSRDLYTWENQPIVLSPYNSTNIFSGSAVVDVNNTSGFFPNQTNGAIAIYTLAGPIQQTQGIAYSFDDGYTFTPYANNPVLEVGSLNFRDPKVLWYEDHWVMIVSHAQEFVLSIYTSPNIIDWTWASNFSHHGLLGDQYECPNLVEIPVQDSDETFWVLFLSIQPGAPLGGSISQYFIGTFNGTHFVPIDAAARIADYGKDNYASQFFYGIPGSQEQISIGWASNWQYCNLVPTGPAEGWQSTMSLPRVNTIKRANRIGWVLTSLPYNLDYLRSSPMSASSDSLGPNGTLFADLSSSPSSSNSGTFLIDVNITSFNATSLPPSASINYTLLSSTSGESLTGGTFMATDATQWLSRSNIHGSSISDNPYWVDKFSGALVLGDTYDFQVVVDRSIVESFANGGEKSSTVVYYPEGLVDEVIVRVGGLNADVVVSVRVHAIEGTWPAGVVVPNGTDVYDGGNGTVGGMRRNSRRGYEALPALPLGGHAWRA